MLRVDWRHNRRRIIIPVSIFPPTPASDLTGREGQALLDTGSTTSGVTQATAEALGLIGRGKRPLGSAQGLGQAERYLFRIALTPASEDGAPRFPFVFDEVIGFELSNSFQWEALLGMDILSQCEFIMRPDQSCSLRFG
jgi:hypothetical protein